MASVALILKGFAALVLTAFPLGAMLQERKAFRDVGLGVLGSLKAFIFIFLWMATSGAAVLLQLPLLILGFDVRERSNTFFEAHIGMQLSKLFMGPVVVNGESNIPRDGKARIFIANHQSMIDICVLYFLRQKFVWISKQSVAFIPGVGQIMWMSGHILLKRKGKASIKQMFAESKARLKEGWNIFMFPQGTRERTKVLPFKHGAFSLAMSEDIGNVDVVPVSIELSDNAWKRFFGYGFLWGWEEAKAKPAAIITVHPTMNTASYKGDKEKMMNEAQEIVYSVLKKKNI